MSNEKLWCIFSMYSIKNMILDYTKIFLDKIIECNNIIKENNELLT